jgi:hypothetical protein
VLTDAAYNGSAIARPVLFLIAVAAVTLTAASPVSAGGQTAPCTAGAVLTWLSTQGTAVQSVTFLMVRNRRATPCFFSALVRFEVDQDGRRATVTGNPLRVRLHAFLRARATAYTQPDVWWANWCGAHSGLEMTARLGTETIRSRFRVLPACLRRERPSTLSVPKT